MPPATVSAVCELTLDPLDAVSRPSPAISQETAFQDVFASSVRFPLAMKTLIPPIIYANVAIAILLFMLWINLFPDDQRVLFVLKWLDALVKGKR